MVRYITIILILLLMATGAEAAIQYNGAVVSGVKSYNSAWGEITPKRYDTGWLALIEYGAEWILVVGMGQSNMVGNPPAYEPELFPVITVEGIEIKTSLSYVDPYEEPSGNNDAPFDYSGQAGPPNYTGSMFGAIIKDYYDATGTKVIILALGANATSSTDWTGSVMQAASTELAAVLSQLATDGYDFDNKIHLVWQQGESDDLASITAVGYRDNVNDIFDYVEAQHPGYTFVFHMCYPTTEYYSGNSAEGMELVADMRDDAFVASTITSAGIHFTMTQLNTIGGLVADSIEAHP